MPFYNLKELSARLVRTDNRSFVTPAGSKMGSLGAAGDSCVPRVCDWLTHGHTAIDAVLAKPNHASAEFEISYVFPRSQ